MLGSFTLQLKQFVSLADPFGVREAAADAAHRAEGFRNKHVVHRPAHGRLDACEGRENGARPSASPTNTASDLLFFSPTALHDSVIRSTFRHFLAKFARCAIHFPF